MPSGPTAQPRRKGRSAADWQGLGVRSADGRALAGGSIIAGGNGGGGPYFLLTQNFATILRYNNAQNYAIGVGHLADRRGDQDQIGIRDLLAGVGPDAIDDPEIERLRQRPQTPAEADNFLDLFGYGLDEVLGQHHALFCDPAHVQSEAYSCFWSDLRRGNFRQGEYRRLAKDGREVWIQATYNPILNLDGKPFKVVAYCFCEL